jgi:hypothetical protein
MKLLDRLALERLISLILNFILAILKLFAPKVIKDADKPIDDRTKWIRRWRKK